MRAIGDTPNGIDTSIDEVTDNIDEAVEQIGEEAEDIGRRVDDISSAQINDVDIDNQARMPDNIVGAGGTSSVLENANYAQKTYSNTFSPEGIKKYSNLAGEPINTIDDLVSAINNGKINVSDLPIEYIREMVILNTRTSQALTQAGIPRSQWVAIDRTANQLFEQLLDVQLSRNKLTSEGISTVRPGGKK